jgi:hypothetical protein
VLLLGTPPPLMVMELSLMFKLPLSLLLISGRQVKDLFSCVA